MWEDGPSSRRSHFHNTTCFVFGSNVGHYLYCGRVTHAVLAKPERSLARVVGGAPSVEGTVLLTVASYLIHLQYLCPEVLKCGNMCVLCR